MMLKAIDSKNFNVDSLPVTHIASNSHFYGIL